jgi:hypothetical protein
MIINNLFF